MPQAVSSDNTLAIDAVDPYDGQGNKAQRVIGPNEIQTSTTQTMDDGNRGDEVAAAVPLSLKLVDDSDSSSSDEHVSPSVVDDNSDTSSIFEFPALSRRLNDSQLTTSSSQVRGEIANDDHENSDSESHHQPKVMPTSNKRGRRIYDKKHYCVYCKMSFFHLPRHLYAVHDGEKDVAEILAADSDKRKRLLTRLRNLGAELHNKDVCKEGTGEVAVVYRPSWSMEAADYNSCEWCHGLYGPRQLWCHKKKCSVKPSKAAYSCVRKVASGWMVSSDIPPEV